MNSNSQDIRQWKADADKQIIVDNLNEMYNELFQTEGIYQFVFDEERQMIIVEFSDEELTEIYVKGWAPSMVIKRVFDEICNRLI